MRARLFTLVSVATLAACVAGCKTPAERLRARCESGRAQSCFDLALLYVHGTGVAQDEAYAAELYQKSCDGAYVDGCYNLALL